MNRHESVFLRACRGEPTPYTPIWLMRQAGRTSREYLELRKKVSFLELCKSPELCTEMAVLARNRLEADASIVFSDILVVVEPLGLPLDYRAGEGPVIDTPVRTPADIDALREVNVSESLSYVAEAVRQTRAALPDDIPLIGFAGAPFTVASYMIEGKHSKNFENTKILMYSDAGAWRTLMEKLTTVTIAHLQAQIDAGAEAIQVFDSWVGCLSPADYRSYVRPHVERLFAALPTNLPRIHFATGAATLATEMSSVGADVLSIDYRTPLAAVWENTGVRALQGNIDPCALLAPREQMLAHADAVIDAAAGRDGHIFNLGGGLLPMTDFDNAIALVAHVHERTQR